MRHAFRPTLTTLALATLMAGCASSGTSSYYSTALTNISTARVNLSGNRLDAWIGCNRLSASARQVDTRLEVGEFTSTRMACQAPADRREQVLIEFLQRSPKLDKTGDMWLLRDNVHAVVVHNNAELQLPVDDNPVPATRPEATSDLDRAIEQENRQTPAALQRNVSQRPVQSAPAPEARPTATAQPAAAAPDTSVAQPRPRLQFLSQVDTGAPVTRQAAEARQLAAARQIAEAHRAEPFINHMNTGAPVTASVPVQQSAERIPADSVHAPVQVAQISAPAQAAPERSTDRASVATVTALAPYTAVSATPLPEASWQSGFNDHMGREQWQLAERQTPRPQPAPLFALETDHIAAPRMDLWQQMGADEWELATPDQAPQYSAPQSPGIDDQAADQQIQIADSADYEWFSGLATGDTVDAMPDMTVTAQRYTRPYAVRETGRWIWHPAQPISDQGEQALTDEERPQNNAPELTEQSAPRDNEVITTSRLDESALERGVRATTSRALNWLTSRLQA